MGRDKGLSLFADDTMSNQSTSHSQFSVYLLPAAFATLNLVACLCAFLASTYDQSRYHNSWNILYNFQNDFKTQFIYIIRVVYFYRKSTVDFNKTSLILQLIEINDTSRVTLRIPAKFFDQNKHNTFSRESGTIKFLLIRDTEMKLIEKIGITHDHQGGELNVSLVDIHDSTKNEGYIACMEKSIKSLALELIEKKQSCVVTHQSNMMLEGDFAITEGISALEFIGPLYMYFSVVSYVCTDYLIAYYQNWSNKPSYTFFYSLHEASFLGLAYFVFIFGIMSIVSVVAKYMLEGKPRPRFMKIFHIFGGICILIGSVLGVINVGKLDPDHVQFILKDANFIPSFIHLWIQAVMFAMGLAIFYGLPFCLIYFILINLLFKEYK